MAWSGSFPCLGHEVPVFMGRDVEGEELAALGGGDTAAEEGPFLTKFASKVTLVVRGEEFSVNKVLIEKVRSHSKVEIRYPYGGEGVPGERDAHGRGGAEYHNWRGGSLA